MTPERHIASAISCDTALHCTADRVGGKTISGNSQTHINTHHHEHTHTHSHLLLCCELQGCNVKESSGKQDIFSTFLLLIFTLVTEHHIKLSEQACSFVFNYRQCRYMLFSETNIALSNFLTFKKNTADNYWVFII